MIEERTGIITFMGNPLTLQGHPVAKGDTAPNFVVSANDMTPRGLSDYEGKVLLICTVPSLDTGVCDIETRHFNSEASALGDKVKILTISCDLPFAQSRWCGAAGVASLETLSDHKELSFGLAYGLVLKELRLLTRAVIVVNPDKKITFMQIVPEVTTEPDYEAALAAVKACL